MVELIIFPLKRPVYLPLPDDLDGETTETTEIIEDVEEDDECSAYSDSLSGTD